MAKPRMKKARRPAQAIPPALEKIIANAGSRQLNHSLFCIANAYATAGQMALNSLFNNGEPDLAGPTIMCNSFAIELLLKFFLVIPYPDAMTYEEVVAQGVDLHGHLFTELYDRLAERHQAQIANAFSEIRGKESDIASFRHTLAQLGDDPFVHWRYIYEEGVPRHLELSDLIDVLNALGKAAQYERRRVLGIPP